MEGDRELRVTSDEFNVFLNPKSVAVIGASEKPDSWGTFVMDGLHWVNYTGKIFPVNQSVDQVFNLPTFRDVRDIEEPVDLAVIAIPAEHLEDTITACGQKGVKGVTVISAGFAETHAGGIREQDRLAGLARSWNMRLLGPNVSGTFNLHEHFNTVPMRAENRLKTSIAAVTQGGFVFQDLLTSAWHQKMGVGKFIHTGNEADLTVTDFMELFGQDPEIKAIVMYIEAIRDGRRFMEVAKRLKQIKPVVVYKAGRFADSARAAHSHTGALSSAWQIYRGLFRQCGIVVSPTMELLLPLAHSLMERPPMRANRVAVITMGGSWGVALADCLLDFGLTVPKFSASFQKRLRDLGLVSRASANNPVDFGASGKFLDTELLLSFAREILFSGEVDALVLHGFGRAGMEKKESKESDIFYDLQKEQIMQIADLEKEIGLPVIIGNHYSQWESQTIYDLNQQGIRIYNHLNDIAGVLAGMCDYWRNRPI